MTQPKPNRYLGYTAYPDHDVIKVAIQTTEGRRFMALPIDTDPSKFLDHIKETYPGLDYSDTDEPPPVKTQVDIPNPCPPPEKAGTDKVGTGLTLIPWYSILAIGAIFIEGLRYGRDNWKKGVNDKEYQEERLEHAMLHLLKWKEGDRSEEHLAKVAWFCVTQLELERLETLE